MNETAARYVAGYVNAPPGLRVRRWSRPSWPPDRDAVLRRRVLDLLRGAGRWRWSQLRETVGGRVPNEEFRAVMHELIRSGDLIEWFEARLGRQQPRHLVCLTERWDEHACGVIVEIHGPEHIVAQVERAARGIEDGDDPTQSAGVARRAWLGTRQQKSRR